MTLRRQLTTLLATAMLLVPPAVAGSLSEGEATAGLDAGPESQPKQDLALASVSAMAADIESHQVLVAKHSDAVLPIASVTKLMTALVVLVICLVDLPFPPRYRFGNLLLLIAMPPYLYLAQRRVYGGGRLANLARTAGLLLVQLVAWVLLMLGAFMLVLAKA